LLLCWVLRFFAAAVLQVLFYPTAIGSEPEDPKYNSYPHWTRTMLGQAAANLVSSLLPS
jgi:N-carbamoylputrescine amidase